MLVLSKLLLIYKVIFILTYYFDCKLQKKKIHNLYIMLQLVKVVEVPIKHKTVIQLNFSEMVYSIDEYVVDCNTVGLKGATLLECFATHRTLKFRSHATFVTQVLHNSCLVLV